METIGERLKRLREAKRLSQSALAKAAGFKSQGAIGNIEAGTRGYGDSVVDIARALGTNPDYLRMDSEDPAPMSIASNVEPGPDAQGLYPLISEVQAGMWTELQDNFAPGDADEWLPSTKNLGPHGYMLRVVGKSMENPGGRPSFPEGMILHVKPGCVPVPGQFVIVRRERTKEATFKKYILIEGAPYLEAINPDWPKEEKYLKLQPDDEWCGIVVDASLGGLP